MDHHTLSAGTQLYHGTSAPRWRKIRGEVAWFTPSQQTALFYAERMAERTGGSTRTIVFTLQREVSLLRDSFIPSIYDYAAELDGRRAYRDWDPDFFAARAQQPNLSPMRYTAERATRVLCAHGFDGYFWDYRNEPEISLCNPAEIVQYLGVINTRPA